LINIKDKSQQRSGTRAPQLRGEDVHKLAGRIAVVTGAASGIGKGIAIAYARAGSDIVVADKVTEEQAADVVAAIKTEGREALFVRTDVGDEASVRAMAEQALARFDRVDILVNNAGIFTESLLEDMPIEDWDRVVTTNLRGVFLCTRFLIGQMLERGEGRIINIASQLGQIGGVSVSHYSASKAGVIGLTKALAREVSRRGVLVNAIAPGPIQTPLLDSETEEWRSAKLAELPIGRFGTVDEITPTAVLLASSDGSYYVGQTLGPNGGDVML
jgi:3-oxoacyl-[acyl-carrier protein] reductase